MSVDLGHILTAAIGAIVGIVVGAVARVFYAGVGAAGVRMANAELERANRALVDRVKCLEDVQAELQSQVATLTAQVNDLRSKNEWLQTQLMQRTPALRAARA